MRSWSPEQIAQAAGARVLAASGRPAGPERVVIDSRGVQPGALFVGLRGATADGGAFAARALAAGAWGVLVTARHAEAAREVGAGAVLATEDPLAALQRLAAAWRRHLRAAVVGVTGSTGKTSTKDLLLAVLSSGRRTVASRANYNTEIGLPVEILCAPEGTEVLVLEMAMRGAGQIAELAAIAQPDVGVIVSVGPVHLELLGSIEAIAAAKAELIAALAPGATAVVPADEPLLAPHLRGDLRTISFGEGGDVRLLAADGRRLQIDLAGAPLEVEVSFEQPHLQRNLLAALAVAAALEVTPERRIDLDLTPGRGQRTTLPSGVTLIDDCYNANPMSMRAALQDLALTAERLGDGRRIAVLGDMLELGPQGREFHLQLGEQARAAGVDIVVTVGELAAAAAESFGGEAHPVENPAQAAAELEALLAPGDIVLVKGSRAMGLELVCRALRDGAPV